MEHLKNWLSLSAETQMNIFSETGRKMGLPAFAIEKDWWAVHTLALIFSMECAPSLIFKGGTSLSKGWDLIQRFSEDIDLALDKEYLGFTDNAPNKKAVNKLRRMSFEFITDRFIPELQRKYENDGFTGVKVQSEDVPNHDQDPLKVEIYYPKYTEPNTYLKPDLIIETGCRSLREPYTQRQITTFVSGQFADRPFADKAITVPVVNPERTFLEKIFLLHEEFQRPNEKKRVERLSRHLYDIEKLCHTLFAEKAFQNEELYRTIVKHRSVFAKLYGVDYNRHQPGSIAFIPPSALMPQWKSDYDEMAENMIYGDKLPFARLIENLTVLQTKINNMHWQ